ncbi:MAG TPA: hypothetical protein VNW92_23570 [Polyangiaceae bacterium]|jgi:hypothetical protein|nr:hypothetical protein [Polyangiaceae bacterium]
MSLPCYRGTSLGLSLLAVLLFASPLWAQTTTLAAAAPAPSAAATPPQLNDTAELARVVNMYEAGKYGECADSLRGLLSEDGPRPLRDPDVIENARIYHAACLIGSGQPQLADEPLRAAIRQNPQMKPPDSLVFPPQVIDHFLRVRETMFDVIKKAEDERVRKAQELAKQQEERARRERQRVAGLERLVQQETVVTTKTRWLALVPFGAGQFQNGKDTLGYVFLTSEVLLAASTLTTLGIETHQVLEANRIQAGGKKPVPSTNDTLHTWYTAMRYSSYAWLGVSVIGILEAQLSFVPDQPRARRRPLPLELRPSAEVVPGGGVFGLSGKF